MSDVAVSFAAGALVGLALAAPPGPMNAVIAEESVVRGWRAGVRAGLGAMTADFLFFLLALAGLVTVLEQYPGLRAAMVTVGGVLMLFFAVGAVQSARETLAEQGTGAGRGFSKALALGLTNPYQMLFWLTVGIGLLGSGELDVLAVVPVAGESLAGAVVVQTGTVALVIGLFAGIWCWILALPTVLVAAGRRVDRATPAVAVTSALVLTGFGLVFLWSGVTTLW